MANHRLTNLALVAALASCVAGHMQISYPYPFHSSFNPANDPSLTLPAPLSIDYSMISPLLADGSNFPCKGYQNELSSTAISDTLVAGEQYTVSLAGTATHEGGSCQFAFSYDDGNTFVVIHSVIGGCPLVSNYTFQIPASAPAADKAILSWSWFNKVGNREMYMDCVPVEITNAQGSNSFTGPALYRANTMGPGPCITTEGDEIVFPNPGDSVEYGGMWASTMPTTPTVLSGCTTDEDANLTVTGSGSSSSSGGSDDTAPAPAPTTTAVAAAAPTTTLADLTPLATTTPATPVMPPTPMGTTCDDNAIECLTETTFSSCWDNTWFQAQPVATGTVCENGQIVAAISNEPSAAPECTDSSILCSTDGKSWSSCNFGQWLSRGPVPAGTVCNNGQFVLPKRAHRRRPRRRAH